LPFQQRETIVDEFTRLAAGRSQKGHRLGLAIARPVARLLGGDLTVDDAPGGGPNCALWLPLCGKDELCGRVSSPAAGGESSSASRFSTYAATSTLAGSTTACSAHP
jgi:hypothetical protein